MTDAYTVATNIFQDMLQVIGNNGIELIRLAHALLKQDLRFGVDEYEHHINALEVAMSDSLADKQQMKKVEYGKLLPPIIISLCGSAIRHKDTDTGQALWCCAKAGYYLGLLEVISSQAFYNSFIAQNKANNRHNKSPQNKVKMEAKELWLEWQKKPTNFKSKADFARFISDEYKDDGGEPIIKQPKTITDVWCKEWESEIKTTPV